ncbi:uncharacterized protein FOMMEDRAFT_37609, partial [Fomitiporia mediterranea MF3/22]|uniref:uncharacterized protein n=1 Tax=Fomitiporia mediterranea (strain MF3/22) TaxID=694068 RepID=UPI0004409825
EIHAHLQGLGKVYLSAQDIQDYLNQPSLLAKLGCSKPITLQTARKWMHVIGYCYGKAPNGMYVDGHKCEDVVHYRQNVFLPLWADYEKEMEAGSLILVTYDESTFYTNDQRKIMWVHDSTSAKLRAKGEGFSIMVSDF